MRYPSARAPTLFPRLAVNILFASEPYFHELVFLLQFAAAAALISQNYGCEIAARISPTVRWFDETPSHMRTQRLAQIP